MNIEEAKRIIQNKIQADEAAREVRSQIKTYIHEKQNVREGFKETFKPLIETSEKVKESIDTQQNKLIKQLQENQLPLTQGLEGNRKAITSGFDKMDEVKKWDLEQLPGYEAIEEAEKEDEEDEDEDEDEGNIFKISSNDLKIIRGEEPDFNDPQGKVLLSFSSDYLKSILSKGNVDEQKYFLKVDNAERLVKVFKKQTDEEPPERVVEFTGTDLNRGLNFGFAVKFLEENELPLPKSILGKSHQNIQKYQRRSERLIDQYKTILANKAKFKTRKGKTIAVALNKNPRKETEQQIEYYNILGQYNKNISALEQYKRKQEGKGIIHFNNPQQLVKRLELLAGSIIAGNNGVKQEFSQIAHLLHQLKVISKKTLNDLLKIYILFN